jgi:hypothetical protein
MALNGQRFMSYDYQKLDRFAESEIWVDCTFLYKSGFLAKIHHDLPKNFIYAKMPLKNKTLRWLLIQLIPMHSLIDAGF